MNPKPSIEEIMNLVETLNEVCLDQTEGSPGGMRVAPFQFHFDGDQWGITFVEQPVWDSENDDRAFDGDEKEPLSGYVKREVMALIETFKLIKLE